jgi:hypothetical protein
MSTKRALLIGCNYAQVPGCTLQGCINDVVNMKTMLTTRMGYDPANVVVLRDDAAASPASTPTRANILKALNALVSASAGCSEIWIHYSGHGSKVRDTNRDEASGYDSVICPTDFQQSGFITDDLLLTYLAKVKCPCVILMDSCFSGTVCDLPWSHEFISGATFRRTKNNTAALSNPNIFMMSGSKDNQTSADIYESAGNGDKGASEFEGAFTDAFLKCLAVDRYKASIGRMMQSVCLWLSSRGYGQTPIFSSSSPTPAYTIGQGTIIKPSKTVIASAMRSVIHA